MITKNKWTHVSVLFVFLIALVSPIHARANQVKAYRSPDKSLEIEVDNISPSDLPKLAFADVSKFLDAFFEMQMEENHVPGAAVVIVQDQTILTAKGYGYADLETNRPVDPERTLFQLASVSKIFTATAIMQLVEDGRLNLDTNVNQYLKSFQVENSFDEPVTAASLLTHTAGFDERNIGYMASNADSVQPLKEYLADRIPPRTIKPNTVISYSNHGYGLAGLLVEEITGEPFARYIENHILSPLGMLNSTFDLPLSNTLSPSLAQGYRWSEDAYEPIPLNYRNVPPAGALSAIPNDLAAFMLAHLNSGRYEDVQLLEEASIFEMHQQQFTHHPELPGMTYGFMEQNVNGYRVLQHGGEAPGYRSLFFLLPEVNSGFFIVYNSDSSSLMKEFVTQFMDQFYPPATRVTTLQPIPDIDLSPYTGSYLLNRYGHRSLEKLLALFNGTFSISADSKGYLVTSDGNRWIEVEPLLFRQVDEDVYLAFQADERGKITHLFRSNDLGGSVPGAYEKLAWFETAYFVNEFYLSWILFIFFTALFWPVAAGIRFLWRAWKKQPHQKTMKGAHAARWFAILFGIGAILFAAGFIQKGLMMIQQGGGELLYGMPSAMNILLWIPIIQAGLMIALLAFSVQAWRKSYWGLLGRLHYTVITLAALAWTYFAVQFNLIGHLY